VSEVSVQFLGSGDAFGSGGRFQTCIYVQSGATRFLIDCGASSLIAMRRFGVDPSLVDIILVTHLHGDHFGGLPFFIVDAQVVSKRTRPLVVAGPPGLKARLPEAMEAFFPGSSDKQHGFPLQVVELAAETEASIPPLVVTAYGVVHSSGAPAYALRVACEDKVIAYSGDTKWTDALTKAAAGADLFVCEAYFFEKQIRNHLSYQDLLRHRAELGCRRLVLTHMSEDMLQRLHQVDSECAEDGKCIVLA